MKPKDKKVYITSGIGQGDTYLSAFDNALADAGIANYNLIYLSSIIPPGWKTQVGKLKTEDKEYGKKLYVVMARQDEKVSGKEAWAGLGWSQNGDGRGLFVEHKGKSKKEVVKLIESSLNDMKKSRPYKYGKNQHLVVGLKCKKKPVCALVVAVYQSEGW